MMIIASIEKYLLSKEHIKKIILAGADALRFNFSYRKLEENIQCILETQQIIYELNASAKIFIDFPINKIRLGDFELKLFPVNENEELVFKTGAYSFDCYDFVPVQLANLGQKVSLGQNITIGDGEVSMQVIEIIDATSIKVKIQNKGVIQYMKTFNIPVEINEDEIINRYTEIIKKIKDVEPEFLAISYINESLWNRTQKIVMQENIGAAVVLKIENEIPMEQLEIMCQNADFNMILIDRGELGVNMPYQKTGIYQKKVIQIAKKFKKTVIISTQLLESTMNNFIPIRAEILDLTNCVLDGVGGIMLCRETAINPRAAYTLSVAKKIIEETEKNRNSI